MHSLRYSLAQFNKFFVMALTKQASSSKLAIKGYRYKGKKPFVDRIKVTKIPSDFILTYISGGSLDALS